MAQKCIVGCWITAAFFGLAGLAQADPCNFNYPGIPGIPATELCGNADEGSGLAPPFQFTLPQFDPQLGQLQSVNFTFDLDQVWGTVSFGYPGVDPSCLAPGVPFLDCASMPVDASYTISVTGASITPLNFGDSEVFAIDYCCDTGPQVAAWMDPRNGFNIGQGQTVTLTAAQASAFIGTGQLIFDLGSSASATDDGGLPLNGPSSAAVTMVNYGTEVDYNFIPAVAPEPSFFFVTGAALLGLVAMRFRRV